MSESLSSLLALSEKASPGPWEDVGPNEQDERCIYAANDHAVAAIIPCGFPETNRDQTAANAAFVVELSNWFRANYSTQSRPEAELPEVTDEMVERAAKAAWHGYFANAEDKEAKLTAARTILQAAYGQQCAATRPAEVGGDGWLPIESAPKNVRILITGGTWSASDREESPFMSVTIAYWCVDHWRGDDLQSHDEWMRHKPTHWQLLPARSAPGSEAKS